MTEDNPIYSFPKLKSCLERKGIVVGKAETYKTVKPGDITIENGRLVGDVSLDVNRMFVVKDAAGVNRNVFLIKKSFYFEYNGTINVPKAHLCICDAISTFGRESYRYAADLPVGVIDRESGMEKMVTNFILCKSCSKILIDEMNLKDLVNQYIDSLKEKKEEVDVDYAGYVKDWQMISKKYRENHHYICEKCGIDLSSLDGMQYCQVHHRNGVKIENEDSNLQCLCVQCHSQVDDRHRQNFSTKAQKQFLRDFGNYKQSHSSSDDPEDTETKNNLKS